MATHPDAKRWNKKHKRALEHDSLPRPHSWLEEPLQNSELKRVIDYACGLSRIPEMDPVRDKFYTGIDISTVALDEISQRTKGMNRVALLRADLENTVPVSVEVPSIHIVTYFYSPYLWKEIAKGNGEVMIETYCARNNAPISDRYCLEPGELLQFFPEPWQVINYSECEESHPETARLHLRRDP